MRPANGECLHPGKSLGCAPIVRPCCDLLERAHTWERGHPAQYGSDREEGVAALATELAWSSGDEPALNRPQPAPSLPSCRSWRLVSPLSEPYWASCPSPRPAAQPPHRHGIASWERGHPARARLRARPGTEPARSGVASLWALGLHRHNRLLERAILRRGQSATPPACNA